MKTLILSLADSVTDQTITPAGALKFKIVSTAVSRIYVGINIAPYLAYGKIYIVGDGHFTDSSGTEDLGTEVNYNGSGQLLYLSAGTYYVILENKYLIKYLQIPSQNNANYFIDEESLHYLENIDTMDLSVVFNDDGSYIELSKIETDNVKVFRSNNAEKHLDGNISSISGIGVKKEIYIRSQALVGNVNALSDGVNLETVQLGSNNLEGDISDFAACTKLSTLYVDRNPLLTGSFDDLFDSFYAAGKVSGTISFYAYNTGCTLGGSEFSSEKVVSFTSSGWQIVS